MRQVSGQELRNEPLKATQEVKGFRLLADPCENLDLHKKLYGQLLANSKSEKAMKAATKSAKNHTKIMSM